MGQSREVVGRALHLAIPAVSAVERTVLDFVSDLAAKHLPVSQDVIKTKLGASSHSTATGVINRLIAAGHLEHVTGAPIQRGLWLRIVATGQQTAEPKCTSPHWRHRTEAVPTPAIHQVRQRNITLASMIEAKARDLDRSVSDFLMDCVYVGFLDIVGEDGQ